MDEGMKATENRFGDATMNDEARIPKLSGDQNVRDNDTGQYTKETRRVTDPENVTVENDSPSKGLIGNYSPFVKGLIALGKAYESSGWATQEIINLEAWIVNGPYVSDGDQSGG